MMMMLLLLGKSKHFAIRYGLDKELLVVVQAMKAVSQEFIPIRNSGWRLQTLRRME